jgi:hypothetical protein
MGSATTVVNLTTLITLATVSSLGIYMAVITKNIFKQSNTKHDRLKIQHWLLNFLFIFTLAFISGCAGSGSGILKNPPICQSAVACAQLTTVDDSLCKIGESNRSKKLWSLKNSHPTRDIYVTYSQAVRPLNSGVSGIDTVEIRGVTKASASVLGCYLRIDEDDPKKINEWSYSVINACFADECPSPNPLNPAQKRDPKTTCEILCSKSDASCIKSDINSADPIGRQLTKELNVFTNRLQNSVAPAKIDVTPLANLANLFTGTNSCWRDDLIIGPLTAQGLSSIENFGSTCEVGFELANPKGGALQITVPSNMQGKFAGNRSEFLMIFSKFNNSPWLSITKPGAQTEIDPITMISKTTPIAKLDPVLTFTGKVGFCAQVTWSRE